MIIELRELSARVRKSEKVSLYYPIMPIAHGIGSRLIHVDRGQLGQGHRQCSAPPADEHEHIGGACFLRCHAKDLDGFTFTERRNDLGKGAFGLKWKPQLIFQVVIPSHGAFFGSVRVDNRFIVDPTFPNRILPGLFHFVAAMLPAYRGVADA